MATFMIVDDSALHRQSLRKLVEHIGGEVAVEAANGREALDLYPIYGADVVIMDVAMPEMDGFEATEGIIRMDGNAKVVMSSPIASAALIEKAMSMGAKEYITKSLNMDEAAKVLRAVLAVN